MTDYILYALLGLGTGAATALLAVGIVVGYRGSGVVNFAQGGIAMYVAYIYYGLREEGRYVLPVPGLVEDVRLSDTGLGSAPSMVIALVTAAAIGLLLDVLVLRPLRHAPTLAKVVATVGVLLMLQAIVVIRFGTNILSVTSMLPSGNTLKVGGSHVADDRLFLALVAVVVAAVVWLVSRRTRLGLATLAAAENEQSAIALGYSPSKLSAISWTVSAVIAGLGGILISPIINLSPSQFSLLIVPALAAALIGKFSSVWAVTIAALGLGMAQNVLTALPGDVGWLPSVGLADVLPLLVIIAVMFVGGRAVPTRESVLDTALPAVPQSRHAVKIGLVVAAVTAVLIGVVTVDYRLAIITTLIASVSCLSLVVVTGFVGQISLFQLTLSGASAYILALGCDAADIPFPFSMLLAALGATLIGLVGAIPALRIRGVNLAVITLAAGWAIDQVYFSNLQATGGLDGATVDPPVLFGLDLSFTRSIDVATTRFAWFVLIVLVLLSAAVVNLRRSDTGRRMLAVRANERAAAAMGIDVRRTKLLAFGVSSFIAGVAGGLMAYQQMTLSPTSFAVFGSLTLLAMAYIGGITSVTGSILGGTLAAGGITFYVLQQLVFGDSAEAIDLQVLISGLALVLTAIFNPAGISGAMRVIARHVIAGRAQPEQSAADDRQGADRQEILA